MHLIPLIRRLLLFILISYSYTAYCQQDIDFHINTTFLQGKNILKIKRDHNDAYLWVLAQNNEVYRINSDTHVMDDYTPQFSAYNNFQFIDISGVSKDTVFIATNSANVLLYKTGTTKIIGAADGIAGPVNSIGIRHKVFYEIPQYIAYIATNNGLCRFDYKTEKMYPRSDNESSKIFESSYRLLDLHDGTSGRGVQDSVKHYTLSSYVNYTIYIGELWLDKSFGNNLKTAYTTAGEPIQPNNQFSIYGNQFWATENGLFQNMWNYSYTTQPLFFPYYNYLKGVDITKISSIYGFIGFGGDHNGLIRENLLVGSKTGLYFSNSNNRGGVPKYTFYHYDPLGNKPINDICINSTTHLTNKEYEVCENGIWIAANDGLYLLTPDYTPYINNTSFLKVAQFIGQGPDVNEIQLCANTTATAFARVPFTPGNNFQWYKNSVALVNQTKQNLTITDAGDYHLVFYDPCTNIRFESNHLKVSLISAPTVTFNYPDQINYCNGTTATLQTDQNSIYQYRWYKNGVLNGNTSSTLNTTTSGKYKVEVSACAGSWVSSKEVQINFIAVPQTTITANKAAFCIGDQATLSTSFVNDGTYTVDWLLNGSILTGNQNKTSIITNQPGNYGIIITSKLVSCSQVSANYNLVFTPLPNINIQQTINTTFCDGQTVNLQASYTGGSIKWSTGETTATIAVKHSGNYVATVTTAAGCIETKNINLQLFENPKLTLPDATLCQFTNETITLTAPTGFLKYEWNGKVGNSTFTTNNLGSVNLVVTDKNGCIASQTINISGYCTDIHYPNTFTPNGDGVNDNWFITGLENDPSTSVRIYNRYGELIFENKGNYKPWDGTYNGKQVVTGPYYFIISARQGKQVVNGSLTIIR